MNGHRFARGRSAALAVVAGLGLALAPSALAAPSATVQIADVADRPLAAADTLEAGSMTVANTSTAGEKIVSFTIDLRERPFETPSPGLPDTCIRLFPFGWACDGPALLPDLAFDPDGGAGDLPGKPLTLDSTDGTIDFAAAPQYTFPVGQGFGAVTAVFPVDVQPNDAPDDFDDGDEATFSFDVDPTSIQGAAAGAPAARIAGSELHGATVTMTFSDGTTVTDDLTLIPGSTTDVRAVLDPETAASLGFPLQRPFEASVRASTPYAQQSVVMDLNPTDAGGVLVVAEGHLDLTGAPEGGTDLDELEANTLVSVTELPITLDEDGDAEIPFTLTDTPGGDPAPQETGINMITAHIDDGTGTGAVSLPMALRLDESIERDPPSVVSIEPASSVSEATAKGIAVVTFDEPMDPGTIGRPAFPLSLAPRGISISGSTWPDPSAPLPHLTSYARAVEGSGGRSFSVHRTAIQFGRPQPVPPLAPGAYTITVTPEVTDLHGTPLGEAVTRTVTLAADPIFPPSPIPHTDPSCSENPTVPWCPAPPLAATGEPLCAAVQARPADEERGRIALSAAQLRISQRIAQSSVRRAAAIGAWLEAGIVGGDICGGALGPAEFQGLDFVGAGPAAPAIATPRPVVIPEAGRRTTSATVRLTASQLLINQRIAQAALRRVNALAGRLQGGLTGGDVVDETIGAAKLWQSLQVKRRVTVPAASRSVTALGEPTERRGDRVTVSASQLRINQRISQAAVRRVNELLDRLARGLTGAEFKDGSLSAADLRGLQPQEFQSRPQPA